MALPTGQEVVDRPALAAPPPLVVRFRALQRVARRSHRVGEHRHDDHEWLLVRQGRYRGLIDGREVAGEAPCLVAVADGQRHEDACDGPVRFDAVQARVLPGPAPGRSAPLLLPGRGAVTRLTGPAVAEATALFDAMIAAGRRGDAAAGPQLDALVAALVWRWVGMQPRESLDPLLAAALECGDLERRLLALFAERERGPLPVPTMAAALGVPVRTLDWHCRKSFGLAPAALFRRHRLRAARAALRATGLSVGTVAAHFGFASAAHFARVYRIAFGRPPGTETRAGGLAETD